MSKRNMRFTEGDKVGFEVDWHWADLHCFGRVILEKADGGLWMVYVVENSGGQRTEIGAIFDDGWEYSDQSAKHPGFFALDGWDSCVPGGFIVSPKQSRSRGCRTLTQAAKLVWQYHVNRDSMFTEPWKEQIAVKPNPEQLPLEVKLARSMAFLRGIVEDNRDAVWQDEWFKMRDRAIALLEEIS